MIKKIIAFVMVFIAAIFLLGAIYMFKTDKGRKYILLGAIYMFKTDKGRKYKNTLDKSKTLMIL